MATVTFPIELGGSGLVVSDDTDPVTGLRNGGYLTRFVPTLQQTVAVAGFVVTQANNAANSATSAGNSATSSSNSATSSANSAALAATLYDQFDDRVLGPKAANPTVDNDGNALLVGAIYFNTTAMETRVWNGTTWQSASVNGGTVNSLIVTGALEYQGTLTGGTGVINIGEGQIYKDAAGNVGMGTLPSDWFASIKALEVGPRISISSSTTTGTIGYNSIFDASGSFRYINSDFALDYRQNNGGGSHAWFIAPSGTAGAPITFTQAMTLTQGGNLLVGTAGDTIFASGGAARTLVSRAGNAGNILALTDGAAQSLLFRSNALGGASGVLSLNTTNGGVLALEIGDIEAARITSARYFKASNTGAYTSADGGANLVNATIHMFQSDQNNKVVWATSTNIGANVAGYFSDLKVDAAGLHYVGRTNNSEVYRVLASGSVQNATNSYGAISDPKLKDIMGPKSSTWEKTKQYNWIEYYLKSDSDHLFKMLGLNAEEALAISPGVVDETPDLVQVTKVRQVSVRIVRLDENENPVVDEETGQVVYDEVMVDEEYTEWEPNGEFTKSVKYSVVSMQYHRTTQECQVRIENLESAKTQTDDLIQQIISRVAALESASA